MCVRGVGAVYERNRGRGSVSGLFQVEVVKTSHITRSRIAIFSEKACAVQVRLDEGIRVSLNKSKAMRAEYRSNIQVAFHCPFLDLPNAFRQ